MLYSQSLRSPMFLRTSMKNPLQNNQPKPVQEPENVNSIPMKNGGVVKRNKFQK